MSRQKAIKPLIQIIPNPFFNIARRQCFMAQFIDRLAVLVHHVVKLKHVFADVKVVAFHAHLGFFNGIGNETVFNHILVAHPQSVHDRAQSVAAEYPRQIVLGRNKESGRAGVTLSSGTSTQLVINAAGFVTLSSDDMQTSGRTDLPCLCFRGRVAAKYYVNAASGHVGRDSYGSGPPSLRDNFGFFLMVFGIENVVLNTLPFKHDRQELIFFN